MILDSIMNEIQKNIPQFDWELEINITWDCYGKKPNYIYVFTYAPQEWSNGKIAKDHSSNHLVKGLNFNNQPMVKICFETIEDVLKYVKEFLSKENGYT
jgi:hypothetical protein